MASSIRRCSPWLSAEAGQSARSLKPTRCERRARRFAQLRFQTGIAPEMERVPGMRLHRQRHIVEHAEIEKQRRDLERAREAEPAAPVHRQRGDVAAGKTDAAGIGRQLAAELGDQRGLAGAVRPDDRVQLAGRRRRASDRRWRRCPRSAWPDSRPAASGSLMGCAFARIFDSSPSMPPRANSTTSSSSGPRMICQYSVMPDSTSSSTKQRHRADQRADDRAHAAEHHHDDEIARARPIHHRGADEIGVIGDAARRRARTAFRR